MSPRGISAVPLPTTSTEEASRCSGQHNARVQTHHLSRLICCCHCCCFAHVLPCQPPSAAATTTNQVSGDVFIGRYFDNEEDFQRLDFTMAELSSSSQWIKEAKQQIMRRSERSGDAQAMLNRLQHPPQQQQAAGGPASSAVQPPQSPSDVEKNKGNEVSRSISSCKEIGACVAHLSFNQYTMVMQCSAETFSADTWQLYSRV